MLVVCDAPSFFHDTPAFFQAILPRFFHFNSGITIHSGFLADLKAQNDRELPLVLHFGKSEGTKCLGITIRFTFWQI